MAYTPTNWQTGDIITAEKLNKAERGIADAFPLVVGVRMAEGSQSAMVMDKTYADIEEAIDKDLPVIMNQKVYASEDELLGAYLYYLMSAGTSQTSGYEVTVLSVQGGKVTVCVFKASSKTDFPYYNPSIG